MKLSCYLKGTKLSKGRSNTHPILKLIRRDASANAHKNLKTLIFKDPNLDGWQTNPGIVFGRLFT